MQKITHNIKIWHGVAYESSFFVKGLNKFRFAAFLSVSPPLLF